MCVCVCVFGGVGGGGVSCLTEPGAGTTWLWQSSRRQKPQQGNQIKKETKEEEDC